MTTPEPQGLHKETLSPTSSPPVPRDSTVPVPGARFEQLLAASGIYLHVLDLRTNRFRYVSPGLGRLLGHDRERWRFEGPRALLRAVHPGDRDFVRDARRESRRMLGEVSADCRPRLTFTFVARMLRPDGSELLLSHHLTFPEVDSTGVPLVGVTTLSDLSFLPRPTDGLVHVSVGGDGGQEPFRTLRVARGTGPDFSRREEEVLRLVSEGLSSREIGARLHITYHTVCTHRKNLMRKAGVTCTVDLLREAQQCGVLE